MDTGPLEIGEHPTRTRFARPRELNHVLHGQRIGVQRLNGVDDRLGEQEAPPTASLAARPGCARSPAGRLIGPPIIGAVAGLVGLRSSRGVLVVAAALAIAVRRAGFGSRVRPS